MNKENSHLFLQFVDIQVIHDVWRCEVMKCRSVDTSNSIQRSVTESLLDRPFNHIIGRPFRVISWKNSELWKWKGKAIISNAEAVILVEWLERFFICCWFSSNVRCKLAICCFSSLSSGSHCGRGLYSGTSIVGSLLPSVETRMEGN